jgi:hypothetical protein
MMWAMLEGCMQGVRPVIEQLVKQLFIIIIIFYFLFLFYSTIII